MDQVNAIYNAEPGLREANKVVAPSSPAKSQKTANKKPKKVAPKAPAKPKTLEVAVKQVRSFYKNCEPRFYCYCLNFSLELMSSKLV